MGKLYWLDFRGRRYGGPVTQGTLYREDGLTPVPFGERSSVLREGTGVVFLVHGFNVNREEGHQTLSGFRNALLQFGLQDHVMVGVLWPGDTAFVLGPFAYLTAPKHADTTAYNLATFIRDHGPKGQAPCFIAHSLGCKVVMEALSVLQGMGRTGGQVVLMAGAVDSDCLAVPARYQKAAAAAQRVTVLSSLEDQVLRLAFPAGDALDDSYSDHASHRALGRYGPEPSTSMPTPPSVNPLNLPSSLEISHHDYLADSGDGSLNGKRRAAAYVCVNAQLGKATLEYPDPFNLP